jgi:hypothetical protein
VRGCKGGERATARIRDPAAGFSERKSASRYR